MSDDIETKLSAARTRLILDKPFLGALVLRLPMIAADKGWCPTTATDARAFYYNPEYIEGMNLEQTKFILAHEALHCGLSHFARRLHRQKHRWDVACDLAVNPILISEGLTPTPDALYLEQFSEMTAEEIYPCLDDHPTSQTPDQHLYDDESSEGGSRGGGGDQGNDAGGGSGREGQEPRGGGSGRPDKPSREKGEGGSGEPQKAEGDQGGSEQPRDGEDGKAGKPPPLSKEERDKLAVTWRQRMAGAAQQAMQAGKMGGALARMIDHLLQPQLPWRMLLAKYMNVTARDDYNYSRPSRREGNAIFPSLRSHEVSVVVALDTSGSVDDEEMRQFLSEVNAIKGQVRAKITLMACDSEMAEGGPWHYEPWDEFQLPREFKGGGGTDFRPVFEAVARSVMPPDLLIYFTDAQGDFPEREPSFPVVWLVKGKGQVPWGQRIQLN